MIIEMNEFELYETLKEFHKHKDYEDFESEIRINICVSDENKKVSFKILQMKREFGQGTVQVKIFDAPEVQECQT